MEQRKVDRMFENVFVSVITPTYNDERFVEQTIRSVLNQTHKNLELIIVDDNSTDSTLRIISSINDSRIRLFENSKNMGAAYSRNKALLEARGDYVAFLDGDDLWAPNKLDQQLQFMQKNNYCFSATFYREIDEHGDFLGFEFHAPKRITHRKFLRANYIGCLTVMYKRNIYPDLQIPNTILKRNDYALWLKLSEKADCFTLQESLSFYRKRVSSVSSGKKKYLIKHNKVLFSALYGVFGSSIFAFRNIFYYIIKRLVYRRKIK